MYLHGGKLARNGRKTAIFVSLKFWFTAPMSRQVLRCTNSSVKIDNKMLAGLKRKKKSFRAKTNQI